MNNKGFTFVEVMIVVAVIGILAAISGTLLMNSVPTVQLLSAGNNLSSNFQRAKSEAVRRNSPIVLSFNETGAPIGVAPGVIPANGYIMFIDDGGTTGTRGDFTLNGDEFRLGAFTLPAGITFNTVNFTNNQTGFNNRAFTIFGRQGFLVLQNRDNILCQINLSLAGTIDSEISTDNGTSWN